MTGYVITDENKSIWVRQDVNGSYSLTTDQNRALIFDSRIAADTVFKSNLSKLIKSKGVMVKSVNLQISAPSSKAVAKKVVVAEPAVKNEDLDTSEYIISVLSDAVAKLNCRHMELAEAQSKYDRQITDVEHYIEFNVGKLNACDGFKAYKLLQSILIQRRKIKDELQIIDVVRDRMSLPDDITSIEERIRELKSRQYSPRELTYLFEDKEK